MNRERDRPQPHPSVDGCDEAAFSTLVHSGVCDAMDTSLMKIECGFTRGFAGMQLIGNTTEVCRDGKERARAALESLGIHIPPRRLVVSLTPAEVKKDGGQFDLPIAVSLALLLCQQPPCRDPSRWLFAAELGLAGEMRPVRGVVSFAVAAMAEGLEGIIVAPDNLAEIEVLTRRASQGQRALLPLAFASLREVLAWLFDGNSLEARSPVRALSPYQEGSCKNQQQAVNFDDMILHPSLELVAMTACAGMHSLLLRGSPGTGKSMLAARLTSILPALTDEDQIDAMRIYSASAERLPSSLLAGRPPYRSPHHQASAAAILGCPDAPGELSLAHGGVLFLDELPEFRRDLLEALREPLETGEVRVSRSRRKIIWKSRVVLVAACNNCPCGWFGSMRRPCTCPTARLLAYRQRLSGPILDRIDLHVNVPESNDATAELFIHLADRDAAGLRVLRQTHSEKQLASASSVNGGLCEEAPTHKLAKRVAMARAQAKCRNSKFGVQLNRDLAAEHLLAASGLSAAEFAKLVNGIIPRAASSRSVIRCLRVARTLADLAGREALQMADLQQAWQWQAQPAAQQRGELLPSV